MYNSILSCGTKMLVINQEEIFVREDYKGKYEAEESEKVQVARQQAHKTFRSDFK